jgi:hypothetical protein
VFGGLLVRREEAEGGQHDAGEDRLGVDAAGLAPDLGALPPVVDRLLAPIQVARATRGEGDSGSLAVLKPPERREPERNEEEHPPGAGGAGGDEERERGEGDDQAGQTREQAPAPLAAPDVGDGAAFGRQRALRDARQARISAPCSW